MGKLGGSCRRKAGRHAAALPGRGRTWLRGFWGTGGRFAVVRVEALAKLTARFSGGALGKDWCGAAGSTQADGDSGSDGRMVQRVGALHRRAALGRVA